MRIYVDIDDVLSETARSLCAIAESEFGRHVDYSDVREFDLQRVFSFSDDEMERFRVLSHVPDVLASFAEVSGAVEGVRSLVAAGHIVDLVTGRPASSRRGTEMWLERAGLGEFKVTYVDKYDRSGIYRNDPDDPPTVTMTELAARRYDVVIDDSPIVLAKLAAWRDSRVLVFDRPWNADFPISPNMQRIYSWADIIDFVRRLRK